MDKHREHSQPEELHKRRFGETRSIIHTKFKGRGVVAVGKTLYFSPKWKTFHDFLIDYLRFCFGMEWGAEELKKPFSERHPVVQWYDALREFHERHKADGADIYSADATGPVMAYLSLAYDLYILQDHSLLQDRLVSRLRNKDQFQGARYETYVAASFVRAGFDIDFEDEGDVARSHCEFSAVDKGTGRRFSVEAKSRHRPGFLGYAGTAQSAEEIKLQVKQLLRKALKKEANHTRVIFIDINMPPQEGSVFEKGWFKDLGDQVLMVAGMGIKDKPTPPAYLFFTNHPVHYVGNEEPEPVPDFLITGINMPEFKKEPVNEGQAVQVLEPAIYKLWDSLKAHNRIPDSFD
jgi:hypothetical protein